MRVWPIMKSNGGYRMIHDHGLRHRTAQHLVKRVVDVFFVPRSFQYTHLGYQAAIQQTKAFITQGYVHVAHLDITDFFGSFDLEKLLSELPFKQATAGAPSNGGLPPQSGKGKGLPLPHEVVEHVVTGRYMTVRLKLRKNPYWNSPLPSPAQLLDTARLGIPQGSACSSVVAAYTVSGLEWSPTPDVKLVNLADDFLLLAKSPKLCAEETDALAETIGKLPGGTFKLKLKTATEASNGFQFLGHHIQLVDGSLHVAPTLAADEDLVGKLDDLEVKLGEIVFPKLSKTVKVDKKAAIQSLAKSAAILAGWKSAFSQCSDIDGFIAPYVDTLSWWLDEIGATVDDLKQAIIPDMEYTPSFYALGK
ncbi:hypothetical protein [Rhodomicrobium vannielii]|nr:hypothetical protein [Rhodomicrobium vannielii]